MLNHTDQIFAVGIFKQMGIQVMPQQMHRAVPVKVHQGKCALAFLVSGWLEQFQDGGFALITNRIDTTAVRLGQQLRIG
jgi:hypothetical protein